MLLAWQGHPAPKLSKKKYLWAHTHTPAALDVHIYNKRGASNYVNHPLM
jgi:hypothetical protein